MFLSIIIPVYNTEKYIRECLDSCLNQDISLDEYEIICVNDGSTDKSKDILIQYGEQYKNVIILNKENGGVSSARNLGLKNAKGDYVWFVDADDYIENNSLKGIKRIIDNDSVDRIRVKGRTFHECDSKRYNHSLTLEFDDNVVYQNILKSKPIKNHDIQFHENCSYGEDTLFLFEVISQYTSKQDLECILYNLRIHSESATKIMDSKKRMEMVRSYFYVGERIKKTYETSDLPLKKRQFAADQMLMVMRKGLEVLASLPKPEFDQIIEELRENGLYPIKSFPESTYTWQQCASEKSGTGKIRNILRFCSIYPWGLYLATVPYKKERMKVQLSRKLRSNTTTNKILDMKNKSIKKIWNTVSINKKE